MPDIHQIMAFAAANHGLFQIHHAWMFGLTEDVVRAARHRGEIVRLGHGVYRFAAVPPTWRSELLAACWMGGFRAFASHRSAAALYRLPGGRRERPEITCERWRRARHSDVEVHELRGLDPDLDVVLVDGIPTASVPLTLMGLAAVTPSVAELALENALRRKLTTLAELDEFLARLGGRGRRGAARLRRLVAVRMHVRGDSDSVMETMLFAALRRHGIPLPERQLKVFHAGRFLGRLDGGWPEVRVGYEYDSDEFHTGRVATAADSARRHRMTAAGWAIITVVKPDMRAGGFLACRAIHTVLRDRQLASETRPIDGVSDASSRVGRARGS